ncbi:hypothetical protein [Vreelandella venusta]|uniref:Uncharacterized protein n=1 Tax=Vreelandella venusta TaxID=44935 RepID=A0AAP9ZC30_9GAMM|nr:hypothetical protein [Halomonas venusta]QRL02435.1 hypothetical protein JDS37_14160 [Halomonas venusta]GEK49474.1 hypothetical protein HVE01_01950 [Halomonas venusta]
MTEIDSWQIVYKRAIELSVSLTKEQMNSEIDCLDIEEKIQRIAQDISAGCINPEDDWSLIIKPVNNKAKLDEKIEEALEVAFRQTVFVRILFEYNMNKIVKEYVDGLKAIEIMEVGKKMISALECAHQHATAWRVLSEVRNNSYVIRSQKANQIKQEKNNDREVLLRSLILPWLSRLRPRNGWSSHVLAAQEITPKLASFADSLQLPILEKEDELSEMVESMIWKEPQLRKAYNENAKNALKEPVKMRKVCVKMC